MNLISKIEQMKAHELQLMEELANLQSRVPIFSIFLYSSTHLNKYTKALTSMCALAVQKRATSFSSVHLPRLGTISKNKLIGSLSSMPLTEEAEQLKKEKKELKEKEKKEREEKKEQKKKEKESRKPKTPRGGAPGGESLGTKAFRGKKADKNPPQNPGIFIDLDLLLLLQLLMLSHLILFLSALILRSLSILQLVFGVPLAELQQKDPSRAVPRIVELLVEYLEQHNVFKTEGIFRASGRNLAIDALRKEFDYAGKNSLFSLLIA